MIIDLSQGPIGEPEVTLASLPATTQAMIMDQLEAEIEKQFGPMLSHAFSKFIGQPLDTDKLAEVDEAMRRALRTPDAEEEDLGQELGTDIDGEGNAAELTDALRRILPDHWPPLHIHASPHEPGLFRPLDFPSAVVILLACMYGCEGVVDNLPPVSSIEGGYWQHAGQSFTWNEKLRAVRTETLP